MFACHIYGTNDGFSAVSWTGEIPTTLTNDYPVFAGEYRARTPQLFRRIQAT